VIFYATAIKFFLIPEETRKKPEMLGRKQYTEEQRKTGKNILLKHDVSRQ